MKREVAIVAAILVGSQSLVAVALADNKMGYKLETAEQASQLHRTGGSLGMKVGPENDINSEGLSFQLLKVEGVVDDSPAKQAGLAVGDQVIAVDGHVFPNTKTFAEYVGSIAPGQQIDVDYMPKGGGPKDAKRVGVTVGEGGHAIKPKQGAQKSAGGLSTGEKVAIGIGAAAVIGCYEFDCYSKLKKRYEEQRGGKPVSGGASGAATAKP